MVDSADWERKDSTPTEERFIVKESKLELTVQRHGGELFFKLLDSNGRSGACMIPSQAATLGQAHSIGRKIEGDYNKVNGTIMELADVSRLVGMVHRSITNFRKPDL